MSFHYLFLPALERDLSSHTIYRRVMNDSWRIKLHRRKEKLICESVHIHLTDVCARADAKENDV